MGGKSVSKHTGGKISVEKMTGGQMKLGGIFQSGKKVAAVTDLL